MALEVPFISEALILEIFEKEPAFNFQQYFWNQLQYWSPHSPKQEDTSHRDGYKRATSEWLVV